MKIRPSRTAGAVAFPATLALLVGIAAPVTGTPGASGYQRPGVTERVSVASDGAQAKGLSSSSAISADGRYVAFSSAAPDLVPGDTNNQWDVFVHDRETGATERVSVASDGAQGNGLSAVPATAISDNGRYVAFLSEASNLVPGDTNGRRDVFVHDRATGTTERVSVASDGTQGDSSSSLPAISADGRHVAFYSFASNLVPGDTNGVTDIFVHDRETAATERVSVASDGTQAQCGAGSIRVEGIVGGSRCSELPDISADGRYVVFFSWASNLVAGDTNGDTNRATGGSDIFVHDRETGTTERVSVASDGTEQNGDSSANSTISADGRYVAFHSTSSNLVPGDTGRCGSSAVNGCMDVFVHDRETGTTEQVSVASDGTQGNSWSFLPDVSADGRYVAFSSWADNLVPDEANGDTTDVFVHDRQTGTTERVSVASVGTEGNGGSGGKPTISHDGRYVAFYSDASNLVAADTNGQTDVFVRDRGPATGVGGLEAQKAPGEVVLLGWATFSGVTGASAGDLPDDGEDALGAEITEASVIYQPEHEALLLRLRLASLPALALHIPPGANPAYAGLGGGVPKVVYRFGFELVGTSYEVRAWRQPSADSPPVESKFTLMKCAPECTEIATLSGGIGTTGPEVRVSVPLEAIRAHEGDTLTGVGASASAPPEVGFDELDEVELPDSPIPVSRVDLGIASPSAPQADVPFTAQADLADGRFSGTLDATSLPPGTYRVWARACLGETCGARSVEVTL